MPQGSATRQIKQRHHDYYFQLNREGKLTSKVDNANYSLAKQRQNFGEAKPLLMTCNMARRIIDDFFALPRALKEDLFNDVLCSHLTVGSTVKKHNVSCQPCWDYYQSMKRKHCGG